MRILPYTLPIKNKIFLYVHVINIPYVEANSHGDLQHDEYLQGF